MHFGNDFQHFCGQKFEEFHQYSAKINVHGFKILKACGFEHFKVKNKKIIILVACSEKQSSNIFVFIFNNYS